MRLNMKQLLVCYLEFQHLMFGKCMQGHGGRGLSKLVRSSEGRKLCFSMMPNTLKPRDSRLLALSLHKYFS